MFRFSHPAPSEPKLGVRPFFLLASLFAALSIGLWAAQFAGWLPGSYLSGPLWHAHEMLFGFTLAVMVGFLLTAARNWSSRPTPTGAPLAALAFLWVAGRVLVLTPFGWAAAIVIAAFPLAAAAALAVLLWASRNRRNYFFIGFLVLMFAAELAIHLAQLGAMSLPAWLSMQLALDLVLFVMVVMAGLVIPMFANNGVRGAGAVQHAAIEREWRWRRCWCCWRPISRACTASHWRHSLSFAPVRTACAELSGNHRKPRARHGYGVLHAAYAWISLRLALRAASALGWVGGSAATRALTVGAAGGLIIGMMFRVARGHTARPMQADRCDIACYGLVLMAAVVRVVVPLTVPARTVPAVIGSAGHWSAGFALYAVRYWRVLTRP